jgi:hypothetical protein
MQDYLIRYWEACLIVNDKQWATSSEFANIAIYHVFTSIQHAEVPCGTVKLQFHGGFGGYAIVDAPLPFKQATSEDNRSMMAHYSDAADMLRIKDALKEIAKGA